MYGLTAAVWTKIWIPHSAWQKGSGWHSLGERYHSAGLPFMPYGGYKQSGIAKWGIRASRYFETKSIQIKLESNHNGGV